MYRIVQGFLGRSWWQQVILIAILSIIYIHIAGLLGTKVVARLFEWRELFLPISVADSLEGRFARWDSGYYFYIASYGYSPGGIEQAFFPLYPILTRMLSQTLGLSILAAGSILSIFSFIGAGFYLYRWIRIDYEHNIALWATTLMFIFPIAFFFVAIYAEPLLLLLSIASAYYARRGNFIAAGITIALAGATRPTAFLLAVPYFVEFWQQGDFRINRWLKFGLGLLIAPIGFIGFLVFASYNNGNDSLNILATETSAMNEEWRTSSTWPWVTFYDSFNALLFGVGINKDWFSRVLTAHDLLYSIIALVASIWAFFRLRLSSSIFLIVATIYLSTVHGPFGYAFWSTPRRVAVLYPLYLVFALVLTQIPNRFRWIPVGISLLLLGILSAWFTSGRWVA